ncbi:MAG: hypothetical protein OEU54_09575 [Gemmatimonadota bacterium]|nr:hypothetical protein [Gemmatimonadota bacterium]
MSNHTPQDPPAMPPPEQAPDKLAAGASSAPSKPAGASGGGKTFNIARNSFSNWTAVAVLIVFLVILGYMFFNVDETNEVRWHRVLFLYGGVEALAFAAAGYLFGRETSRGEVAKAEDQADTAKQDAVDATGKAARAKTAATLAERKAKQMLDTVRAAASDAPAVLISRRLKSGRVQQNDSIDDLADQLEIIYKS